MPRDAIDPSQFDAIQPTHWYAVADVARLFGRDAATVRRWIRGGTLAAQAEPTNRHALRVQGQSILKLAEPFLRKVADPIRLPEMPGRKGAGQGQAELERFMRLARVK